MNLWWVIGFWQGLWVFCLNIPLFELAMAFFTTALIAFPLSELAMSFSRHGLDGWVAPI